MFGVVFDTHCCIGGLGSKGFVVGVFQFSRNLWAWCWFGLKGGRWRRMLDIVGSQRLE